MALYLFANSKYVRALQWFSNVFKNRTRFQMTLHVKSKYMKQIKAEVHFQSRGGFQGSHPPPPNRVGKLCLVLVEVKVKSVIALILKHFHSLGFKSNTEPEIGRLSTPLGRGV